MLMIFMKFEIKTISNFHWLFMTLILSLIEISYKSTFSNYYKNIPHQNY